MKRDKLNTLSCALKDQFEDKEIYSRFDMVNNHHVLYDGDPDSGVMVVCMQPEKSEVFWAQMENIHQHFVCRGPNNIKFRHMAKKNGFDTEKDFFYCNITPFFPIGGRRFDDETVDRLFWIFEGIVSIVKPKIIITLGYRVFKHLFNDRYDFNDWRNILLNKTYTTTDTNTVVLPLDDPEDIGDIYAPSTIAFASAMGRLYTVKDRMLNKEGLWKTI